jgi:hypothetical protein
MTLRFLAGGNYLDIMDLHGVGESTFYRCLHRSLKALDQVLRLSYDVSNTSEMESIEKGFATLTDGVLRGTVGALDGLAVKIRKPARNEVPDPMSYWNRKVFFAINVQAIVDSDRIFRWYSAATTGSTHDATAFNATFLSRRLEAGDLDKQFQIVGDEAYGLRSYLVTPYSGRMLPIEKDSFNFYQSRLRINVECAFGILVARWGVLWRKIHIQLKYVPLVVGVCIKLHNICTQHMLEVRSVFADGRWGERERNSLAPDGPFVYTQSECAVEISSTQHKDADGKLKREQLCADLRNAGLRRPVVVRRCSQN